MTTLLSTGQFDVVGICSEEEEFDPPGFQFEDVSSVLGIINRGENGGVAETFDDDDLTFDIGEGVAFDYLDGGDIGTAVLPNGHWIHVLGGTITEFQTNPNFGTGCTLPRGGVLRLSRKPTRKAKGGRFAAPLFGRLARSRAARASGPARRRPRPRRAWPSG